MLYRIRVLHDAREVLEIYDNREDGESVTWQAIVGEKSVKCEAGAINDVTLEPVRTLVKVRPCTSFAARVHSQEWEKRPMLSWRHGNASPSSRFRNDPNRVRQAVCF